MDSDDARSIRESTKEASTQAPWTPGVWPRFPWIATASILVSLCMAGLMVFITSGANNSNVSTSNVLFGNLSPPVLLALASTIANMLIAVALSRGAANTWWHLSIDPTRDTRVRDLHWRCAAAEGLFDALESTLTRGPSRAAVACIFTTIVAINSPLLQRALTVRTWDLITAGARVSSVYAAPKLPQGFGAYGVNKGQIMDTPSDLFRNVMQAYTNRSPMVLPGEVVMAHSNGTYKTKIPAAGYYLNCTSEGTIKLPSYGEANATTRQYLRQYTTLFGSSVIYREWMSNDVNLKSIISVITTPIRKLALDGEWRNYNWNTRGRHFLFDTVWKPESGCIDLTHGAELKTRSCNIVPAIVNYPVLVTGNNTITLLEPEGGPLNDEIVLGSIETFEQAMKDIDGIYRNSTHAGFALLLNSRFSANYSIRASDDGLIKDGFWDSIIEGYLSYEMVTASGGCDRSFTDPGPFVFKTIRELGLRSALSATNTSDPSHRLELVGDSTETIAIYVANFGYLYSAVVVTVLAALSVLPLFYGFWKLGRQVTLSPLETAKAFRPIQLDGAPSNSTAGKLLKRIGERPIRYGVVGYNDEYQLVFGMDDPDVVVHPDKVEYQEASRVLNEPLIN